MSASTSTSSGGSSTPNPPSHGHGLRTQLGHLIPRHALFQVHLHIDQLSNVPLIKGEFGVRWKFKNVQSGSGLLAKMKGHRTWSGRGKAAGAEGISGAEEGEIDEEDETEGDSTHDMAEDDQSAADSPRSLRDVEAQRAFETAHPPGAFTPSLSGAVALTGFHRCADAHHQRPLGLINVGAGGARHDPVDATTKLQSQV